MKKGGTFAIHDIFSAGKYGDMHVFVEKLKEMGYEKVDLIDTTNGKYWLLVCTVRHAWLIIPGTENCSSYSDYGHHFKGFLIGCIYTTLIALIFAGIDYAILYFRMWR